MADVGALFRITILSAILCFPPLSSANNNFKNPDWERLQPRNRDEKEKLRSRLKEIEEWNSLTEIQRENLFESAWELGRAEFLQDLEHLKPDERKARLAEVERFNTPRDYNAEKQEEENINISERKFLLGLDPKTRDTICEECYKEMDSIDAKWDAYLPHYVAWRDPPYEVWAAQQAGGKARYLKLAARYNLCRAIFVDEAGVIREFQKDEARQAAEKLANQARLALAFEWASLPLQEREDFQIREDSLKRNVKEILNENLFGLSTLQRIKAKMDDLVSKRKELRPAEIENYLEKWNNILNECNNLRKEILQRKQRKEMMSILIGLICFLLIVFYLHRHTKMKNLS